MKNYRVQFIRIEKENDKETGKLKATGELEYLGEITIDDNGVGENLTLASKAFRHSSPKMLSADKLIITQVNK